MTERAPVSVQRPIWYDAQQVDETDLTAEQLANEGIESAIIENHVGDGILPETLVSNIIFNSSLATGLLDGLPIVPVVLPSGANLINQPSDNNLGNQLAVTLTNSAASGKRQVKVCIIGLDFQENLQYEIFYFDTNETQVTGVHFTQVLLLLFNDFIGNPELSFNLGGQLVISETTPMTLSRDIIMVAQDQQPNLFFGDFFLDTSVSPCSQPISLATMLQNALPLYNLSVLGIYNRQEDIFEGTLLPTPYALVANDVTTQIGEKFQATTDNIQKITLLLSVQNLIAPYSLSWTGDIVVSIYPLQVTLDCPTDLVPNAAINYPPNNIPYAQISYNYTTLLAAGIVLNSVPQPVDFVFSNSPIAGGNIMSAGQYCAVTVKRSGSANLCNILVSYGQDLVENSFVTTFSGNLWVDITSANLWFRVYTDAAKISDGQAYDAGNGVTIPKTTIDPTTQATIDYILGGQEFAGSEIFSAVLAAVTQDSAPVPDQRTGNPVSSRQQYVPQITLTDPIDLTNLEVSSEPLILGTISDQNIKTFTPGYFVTVPLFTSTIVNDQMFIRVVDDTTDGYRYNTSVSALISDLLNGNFVEASIIPDPNVPVSYRIASAQLVSMIVGDVDGNGVIDDNDLALLNNFIGFNDGYGLNIGLPEQSNVTLVDGYHTTFVNGYQTLTQPFSSQSLANIVWQLVDPANDGYVVASGSDGYLTANPTDPNFANFSSLSVAFSYIFGLSTFSLVIITPGTNQANLGGWAISGVEVATNVITIKKLYLDGNVIAQMLRADIDGDFIVTSNDQYLLNSYVERVQNPTIFPFPNPNYTGPTSNPFAKIGTRFNVIQLRLEQFVDRSDDYTAYPTGYSICPPDRDGYTHPVQDIFANDSNFSDHNFFYSPIQISIIPQLVWVPYLVVSSSQSKLVPSVFTYEDGFVSNPCVVDGVVYTVYPSLEAFDPGRVDVFAPNNIIIGPGGQLQTTTGNFYKVDFEIGTVILEIPDGLYGSERTIDIVNDFIVSTVGNNGILTGYTRLGFPAMRFADCSFVTADALANNQINFSVAVQSFSPNTNGLSPDGYYGAIVDGKMGVNIDYSTGFLTINFTNLYQDPVLQTLSTKIQVSIFLKQGGFNNMPLFVNSTQVENMLSLISTFSGANEALGEVAAGGDLAGYYPNPIVVSATGEISLDGYGFLINSNQIINQPTANNGTITNQVPFMTHDAVTTTQIVLTIPNNSAGLVTVTVAGANALNAGSETWSRPYMNQNGVLTPIGVWTPTPPGWQGSAGATSWTVTPSHTGTTITIAATAVGTGGFVNWIASVVYTSVAT